MKKGKKQFFIREVESEAYQAPYREAIRQIVSILEECRESTVHQGHRHIEAVTWRIKSPQSIMDKLKRKGREVTPESARRYLNDLAGVRVTCCYYEDVYQVANMLLSRPELILIKQKDFICSPKKSGYRSLHLIFEVDGLTLQPEEEIISSLGMEETESETGEREKKKEGEEETDRVKEPDQVKELVQEKLPPLPGVRVEVQIRTLTMDAWARLDHELRYKNENGEAAGIIKALRKCSDAIAEVDDKMQEILERIRETV